MDDKGWTAYVIAISDQPRYFVTAIRSFPSLNYLPLLQLKTSLVYF